MIYKMCHAARAYLVVDGETWFTVANECAISHSVPRKYEWNQLPP